MTTPEPPAAHNFVIPEQVLAVTLRLLADDLKVAATFNRDYEDNFGGGKGTVVNVRVPATLKARRRALDAGTEIVLDHVAEDTIPVTLDEMIYSAVPITDEDLTLRIEDFTRQIVVPQVRAMVEDIEDHATAELQALDETVGLTFDPAKPANVFTRARKILRDMGMPADGMFAAVGTGIYADIIDSGQLTDVSQSGSTGALRNAVAGDLRGFSVVENNRLDDGEIVWYNRDAFTLAIRAPRIPEGVTWGVSRSENGFAMRWIRDYDAKILQDRSIFSTFIGTQALTVSRMDPTTKAVSQVTPALRIVHDYSGGA